MAALFAGRSCKVLLLVSAAGTVFNQQCPTLLSVDSGNEGDWMDLCLHTFSGLKFCVDDTAKVRGSLGLAQMRRNLLLFYPIGSLYQHMGQMLGVFYSFSDVLFLTTMYFISSQFFLSSAPFSYSYTLKSDNRSITDKFIFNVCVFSVLMLSSVIPSFLETHIPSNPFVCVTWS